MIPEQFIQELLNRVDIVEVIDQSVPLKKAGANYSACCPFHNEKSPSFTVSPNKQFYHCFGCGAHGSAISFLIEYAGLSFVEAVHELSKTVGMIVPQQTRDNSAVHKTSQSVLLTMQETLQQTVQYYKTQLKQSTRAIAYLKGRGLSGQIAAKFQIGYAPAGWQNLQTIFSDYEADTLEAVGLVTTNEQGKRYDRFRDRIMFPIHSQKGEVIGFGGRVINPDDTPKYYNSPETTLFQKGHELYGLFLARRSIREAGRALVVEGYMDVVALAQYAIYYAVAALGTATTPVHITKLMRQTDEIVFCFDGDNAGKTAAWRAVLNALPVLKDGLRLRFLFLPESHDPDSYVRAYGKEQFEEAMAQAQPLSQYIIHHLTEHNPLATQEDRVQLLKDAEPILKQIQAPHFATILRKEIGKLAGLNEQEIQAMLKLSNPTKQAQSKTKLRSRRAPASLYKRLALLLLLQPAWAKPSLLELIAPSSVDEQMLHAVLETALTYPQSKTAALLTQLEGRLSNSQLVELEHELALLDDGMDFQAEFAGAYQQVTDNASKNKERNLLQKLQAKPLSSLSEQEREQLKQLTRK